MACTSQPARVDVAISQLCVPHYRVPFFRQLTRAVDGRAVIVAGSKSFGLGPLSVESASGVTWRRIYNFFILSQVVVQRPVPREMFEADLAVLEFNPRILSNLWVLWRRRRLQVPTILWGHGLSARRPSSRWRNLVRKRIAELADAVILYSEKGRQDLIRLGIPAERLFVAPNSIDTRRIQSLAVRSDGRRRHILYVGRLIAAKKLHLLLDAFSIALKHLPSDTDLFIVGDGPERAALAYRASALGASHRVHFLGEVTQEESLARFFSDAAVSVSPGCVGLFAVHSLSYGVPMLAADGEPHGPEIEALVPGENSEFFRMDDPASLAEKLVTLLADPVRTAAMGDAGTRLIREKYSVERMVQVFLQAFAFASDHRLAQMV